MASTGKDKTPKAVTRADVNTAKRILAGISAQYEITPNIARVLVTHLQWHIAGLTTEEVAMLEEVNVRGWGF